MKKIINLWTILSLAFFIYACNNNINHHENEKNIALEYTKTNKKKLDYAFIQVNLDIDQIKSRMDFIHQVITIIQKNPTIKTDENYTKLLATQKIYQKFYKKHPSLVSTITLLNEQNNTLAEDIIDNKYVDKKKELKLEIKDLSKEVNKFLNDVDDIAKPAKEVDLLYNRLDDYYTQGLHLK